MEIDGDRVALGGEGSLDLGGIAKGWTVDQLAARATSDTWWIDGGGDLRIGPTPVAIGLADWVVDVADSGVATSSIRRRAWAGGHHLVDPRTGAPTAGDVHTASAIAADTLTAEILAKALIVDLERGLAAAAALGGDVLVGVGVKWRMCEGMLGRVS